MNYARWSYDLLTGHKEIDSQHREIFNQADKLLESGRAGKSKEHLDEMLDFFEKYVYEHLILEEKLQRQIGYPGYEEHKAKHDDYRRQFLTLKGQYEITGPNYQLAIKTITFTIEWLTNHIQRLDKEIAAFIREQNRQKIAQNSLTK